MGSDSSPALPIAPSRSGTRRQASGCTRWASRPTASTRSRFDPTGKLVAAAGLDKSIRIWALEAKSGRLLQSQIAHEDAILKLAWSPDGSTLVSASADKTLKVFKVPDLTEIKTIARQSDWVYGLEFAPDGKTFAAGRYDGSLSIYEMNGFRDIAEVRTASR